MRNKGKLSVASAANITTNVVGTNYKCGSWSNEQYPLIDLFGKKYVPLRAIADPIWKSHIEKLAELILDSNDTFILETGDKFDLGLGYTLEAKQVDVEGEKVWLEFTKDGEFVDDEIISVVDAGANTWEVELDDIQDVDDVVVFRVHVNQILLGAIDSIAKINGLWLIDYSNPITLKVGDEFGNLILAEITNGVDASNLGSLVFNIPKTSIEVISPTGSENWLAETSQVIQWKYSGNPGRTVKIELLKGDGSNSIINSITSIGNDGVGSYEWLIPVNQIPGNDYKVRITSITNSAYNSSSDNFTISSP